MAKPLLPDSARRRVVTVTLAPSTIELLDGCVAVNCADGHPGISRSRVVEQALLEWFAMTRESKTKRR